MDDDGRNEEEAPGNATTDDENDDTDKGQTSKSCAGVHAAIESDDVTADAEPHDSIGLVWCLNLSVIFTLCSHAPIISSEKPCHVQLSVAEVAMSVLQLASVMVNAILHQEVRC